MAKISIIGTGYVGLVTGTVFAQKGHDVLCCDVVQEKIEALSRGEVPFFEPGLSEMLERVCAKGLLHFSSDIKSAVDHGEFIFIAVGTPTDPETGHTDMTAVLTAAAQIAQAMETPKVIVVKSTVPVGTAKRITEVISQNIKPDITFSVLSNPEFLREGGAIQDALRPARVIIGAKDDVAARRLVEVFTSFEAPMIITSQETAELCKYACNVFLATKISFANMLGQLAEKTGADAKEITKIMGSDERIGSQFLGVGLGFGGSCFPKDVRAFASTLAEYDCSPAMVQAVLDINADMPRLVAQKIETVLGDLAGKTIAFWGLAFKPHSDDMREAQSVKLAHLLMQQGAQIRGHDPVAMTNAKLVLPELIYCKDAYEACEGADAMVLVTEWPDYRHLDLKRVGELMRGKAVFDGRNFLDPEAFDFMGLDYYGTGRKLQGLKIK